MASGVMYTPSAAFSFSTQEYDDYPYEARRPEYTPHPSSRPLPVPTQQQQAHQVWAPPSRSSAGSYVDPTFVSPPPLRRSLADDPAFATDPNINPNINLEHWYIQANAQSITPFPSRSHSGLDLPHGFVPQSGPVPNTSPRAHSHHEDTQPVYFVPPSIASSSSASDSSASNSSFVRPPRSSVRNSDYAHENSDSPFRPLPPIEVQYGLPDERQPHPRNGKHRPKRRSPHSAQPARNHVEASGVTIPSIVENPTDGVPRTLMSSMTIPSPPDLSEHSKDSRRRSSSRLSPPDLSDPRDRGRASSGSSPSDLSENSRDSRGRTSSRPTAPDLSENPRDSRVRTSSRPTPPDLDSIDELDETNPYGFNVHHRGPYEAVAAILNEANPIDSPLLRVKGLQQQVSASARVRPSRHAKSEPAANPMSLNLQPGQILSNSIYQPTQPSHFPVEFSRDVHPTHDIRTPRGPFEITSAGHDTATDKTPLRRNQTLPAANFARSPPEQSYQLPPVTSEVPRNQRPYPTDSKVHQSSPPAYLPMDSVPSRSSGRRQASRHPSEPPHEPFPSHSHRSQSTGVGHATTRSSHNTGPPPQIAPVPSMAPSEAPPTPDLEQRFSHTLYLTNPDETTGTSDRRLQGPPLPTAPEMIFPSGERRPERPRRSYHGSLYGAQPPLAATHPTESEGRHRGAKRGSPPDTATTSEQDLPRRYEAPSQTIAAINAGFAGRASSATSSSSRTSSSLAPRHVPKRLVMPTPLANSIEGASLTVPSAATFSRPNSGRPGHVLRKRNPRGDLRPQRTQSFPQQTVKGGIFSLFRFGKGSKPVVREVRVTEQPRAGLNEKGQRRIRTREEPRKLNKQRR